MAAAYDIAIIGAGPAGAAAALTLGRHAPSLRTVLISNRPDQLGAGEMLPALARPLLEQLDVWDAFDAAGFVPARAVASAWSGPRLVESHSLF